MRRIFCDSPIHMWCALSLAFIFLFAIILTIPAAADVDPSPSPSPSPIRPNEPIGWKDGDTFRDIMLAVLDGWGISFSKSDPDDSTPLLDYADDLLEEFYVEQNTTSDIFWDLVQYGASETGDIILDFLGVNKIRQFANWLKDKYSLSDNSSVDVSGGSEDSLHYGVNSLVLPWGYSYSGSNYNFLVTSSSSPVYMAVYGSSSPYHLFFFSLNPAFVEFSWDNRVIRVQSSFAGLYYSYVYDVALGSFGTIGLQASGLLPYNTMNDITNILYNWIGDSSSYPSIVINTQIINIPSEDMDPEDGLQIEVPGTNWGDSIYTILNIIERLIGLYDSTQLNINTVIELISTLLQGLQKSVAVENIPGAVVLDYDEYDIPLETEWSLVDGFFSDETEGSPFSTLTTILYGLPEPFILFFSVIVVFVVAYGFIRLGRDSH